MSSWSEFKLLLLHFCLKYSPRICAGPSSKYKALSKTIHIFIYKCKWNISWRNMSWIKQKTKADIFYNLLHVRYIFSLSFKITNYAVWKVRMGFIMLVMLVYFFFHIKADRRSNRYVKCCVEFSRLLFPQAPIIPTTPESVETISLKYI